MAVLCGEHRCKCGHFFKWRVVASAEGEIDVFWVERANENAKVVEYYRGKNVIEVCCPQCNLSDTIVQK